MSYIVNWTPGLKEEAIKILTTYLSEHGSAEHIHQNDDAIITAPQILGEIADLKGLCKYDSEEGNDL